MLQNLLFIFASFGCISASKIKIKEDKFHGRKQDISEDAVRNFGKYKNFFILIRKDPDACTVWPTDMAPVSAYWMYIKTATYRSNSFSCGFIETLPCGVFIAGLFFSHIQCTGAVHGFWSFYYGGKGPYLGVFPILQCKRPQGEDVFFLGISNLDWFGFLKAQFWWHGILQRQRLPQSGLNSKGKEEQKWELVRF